jgi:hypothetical protein
MLLHNPFIRNSEKSQFEELFKVSLGSASSTISNVPEAGNLKF